MRVSEYRLRSRPIKKVGDPGTELNRMAVGPWFCIIKEEDPRAYNWSGVCSKVIPAMEVMILWQFERQ